MRALLQFKLFDSCLRAKGVVTRVCHLHQQSPQEINWPYSLDIRKITPSTTVISGMSEEHQYFYPPTLPWWSVTGRRLAQNHELSEGEPAISPQLHVYRKQNGTWWRLKYKPWQHKVTDSVERTLTQTRGVWIEQFSKSVWMEWYTKTIFSHI